MPGFGQRGSAVVTPGRQTEVLFDVADCVVSEEAWGSERAGHLLQLHPRSPLQDSFSRASLIQRPDGSWCLKPLQIEAAFYQGDIIIYNATITDSLIPLSGWTYPASQFGEHAGYARTTPSFGLPSVSPNFMRIRQKVAAANANTTPAEHNDVAGYAKPALPGRPTIETLRSLVTKDSFAANQGFGFLFFIPGTFQEVPGALLTFYFGQFALTFGGGGICILYRRKVAAPQSVDDWDFVDTWRFAQQKDVCGRAHVMLIWPDKYNHIDFVCDSTDQLQFAGGRVLGNTDAAARVGTYIHRYFDKTGFESSPSNGPHITTVAEFARVDFHPEVRAEINITRLSYPTNVVLCETPVQIELANNTTQPLNLGFTGDIPMGCNLVPAVYDATTHMPLTALGPIGPNGAYQFTLPGGANAVYVIWTFTSDGKDTPILRSSWLWKDAVPATLTPDTFTGGNVRKVSVTGPCDDISHETCGITITDPTDALPALRSRDKIPFQVQVNLDTPLGTQNSIILFRGYTSRTRGRRKATQIRYGSGGFYTYPNPNWHEYSLRGLGMFERLQEQHTYRHISFGTDGNAAPNEDGDIPPWKVTDVIRYLLTQIGFPDSMISIPDLPYRLWSGDKDGKPYTVNPNAQVSTVIAELCKDYLGGWLWFDANMGTLGTWRLGTAPQYPYTYLAGFYTSPPVSSSSLPHLSGAYPQFTNLPTTFLQADEPYVIAPEYNGIIVLGDTADTNVGAGNTVHTQWAANLKSYGTLADSTSEDYRGRPITLVIGDPTLIDQKSVDWECRRAFDYICHGRRMREGVGPLMFVKDAQFGHYRPLTYYDPVQIDGDPYFVISCNPDYNKDEVQMAHYEFQKARTDQLV